jgi:N-acetylneuraminic acid mutarotase
MVQRFRVAISILFFLDVIVPASAYAQRVPYGLDPGSTFQRGCFPPCLCPIFATDKIQGTFTLEFIGSYGTFDQYAVNDVQMIVLKADKVIPISGSGTYQVAAEPARQRLFLDLKVGDEEQRFDSGLVPITAAFPSINIVISIHGMRCFDTAIAILASPVVQRNNWVTVAPLPAPMMLHGAVMGSDRRIYAFGGTSNDGPPVTANVFAYDVGADVWTTAAPLAEGARRNFAYARDLNGLVYALGGYNFGSPPFPLARAERYDPAADAWMSLPEVPTPRQGAAAATGSDGRIYVMGGTDPSFQTIAIVEVFDPGTDTWTTVAPMNTPRTGFGATAGADGRIYVFGGYSGSGYVASAEVYDPASGLWTTIASMNEIRFSLAAATSPDGRLYAIGGGMEGTSVEAYDPAADVWTYVASMSTPRHGSAATLGPDGRIYAIGGDAIGSVEAYTPGIATCDLRGGMLATFDVVGQRFTVWVTNKTAIDQVLAIQQGRTTATIPVARILRGPGQAAHNAPYHWHMDPDNIEFAVAAIEVCDGTPSFVESHIDYFVDVVKTYCPWSAKLVALQDYR